MARRLPDLSHLVSAGAILHLKVAPRAAADAIEAPVDNTAPIRIRVTAPPDRGQANAAVLALLARALGIPKSRLTLIRGAAARAKQVRID